MTAKERVRAVHPHAMAKRQKTLFGPGYWLVYASWSVSMYIGHGDTQAQAWKNAASNLPSKPDRMHIHAPGGALQSQVCRR